MYLTVFSSTLLTLFSVSVTVTSYFLGISINSDFLNILITEIFIYLSFLSAFIITYSVIFMIHIFIYIDTFIQKKIKGDNYEYTLSDMIMEQENMANKIIDFYDDFNRRRINKKRGIK